MLGMLRRRSSKAYCTFFLTALLGALPVVAHASGQCTRHFYNKSDTKWKIKIEHHGPYTLEAGKTITHYWRTDDALGPRPNWIMLYRWENNRWVRKCKGKKTDTSSSPACSYSLKRQADRDCIYIKHNGSTGVNTLNEPANGDLILR